MLNKNKPVYVYRHIRLDTDEVFYIGIGIRLSRPFTKFGRNRFWNKIVGKTNFIVEIIQIVDNWEDACELEELLILEYGRRDLGTGTLVNLTDGGEGTINCIRTIETCKKISINKKGKPHSKIGKEKKEKSLGRKIIDTSNNKFYESITSAAKDIGVERRVLSRYLNGTRKNKTKLKYYNESN